MLDLAVVKEAEDIGFTLKLSKSEIITRDRVTLDTLLVSLPGARVVDPAHATFLGSPHGDGESVSRAICEKTKALKRVSEKFVALSAHDALILLRKSFAIPKLQYLLQTAPCFQSESLVEFDNALR